MHLVLLRKKTTKFTDHGVNNTDIMIKTLTTKLKNVSILMAGWGKRSGMDYENIGEGILTEVAELVRNILCLKFNYE